MNYRKLAPLAIRLGFALAALGLFLAGCGQDGAGKALGGLDTALAAVEGRVEPAEVEAEVYLSRGGDTVSTVTRDGWFQLSGIDYGLYVLEAKAEGYGGIRQLLSVGERKVLVGPLRLEVHPWPISRVHPLDSLVFRANSRINPVEIRFSQFMDRSSVENALRMVPACTLDLRWDVDVFDTDLGDVLTVGIPPGDLRFGEPHTLILDTSARTREGHALEKAFSLPVVRRFVIPGEGALPIFRNQDLDPVNIIRIDFPQAMDKASVASRIYLFPAMPYTTIWDAGAKSLGLVPDTRWGPGDFLTVGVTSGYRSSNGETGPAASTRLYVRHFGLAASGPAEAGGFENEHLTVFNMPVDMATLRYRMEAPVTATARQTAPETILWSFGSADPGRTYTLRIESLHSIHGDSLTEAFPVRYSPTEPVSNLRLLDSSQGVDGLRPQGDTLKVAISRSAFARLGVARFSLDPDFPVETRLQRSPAGESILLAHSPQPWPAGTRFKLFPDTGAAPGDTLGFSTRALEARILQPFQGETAVEPSRNVELLWNTLIDTLGFADRLRFEPPVDSLRIEQDTVAGGHRTRIRHAPFASSTRYRLEVHGVTDLFSQGLPDTLEIRFQTRP